MLSTKTIKEKKSYITLALNAHIPYIHHDETDDHIQETWLFSALTETYIPLLNMFQELEEEEIPFKITISISPSLATMMNDTVIQEKYIKYLKNLIKISQFEINRTTDNKSKQTLAKMYKKTYEARLEDFEIKYKTNLIDVFRKFDKKGYIELIATGAAHIYLPHYKHFDKVIETEIKTGGIEFASTFARQPKGFWLTECGYTPGIEEKIKEANFSYMFTSSESILYADTRPKYGIYAPIQTPNGISFFGLNHSIFRSIYSSSEGFPARSIYRNPFFDIGYELAENYWAKLQPGMKGQKMGTGIRYYSYGDDVEKRELYNFVEADNQAKKDAQIFVDSLVKQNETVKLLMKDRPPLYTCAFDAELFGHWWYEGITFLKEFIKGAHNKGDEFLLLSPSEYLRAYPINQTINPTNGSRNEDTGASLIDGSNDWIYRHTNKIIRTMTDLANRYDDVNGLLKRILNQAMRETLLSLSSDWPYNIKRGYSPAYAGKRILRHIENVNGISESLSRQKVKTSWITTMEKQTPIFPDIDYSLFQTEESKQSKRE